MAFSTASWPVMSWLRSRPSWSWMFLSVAFTPLLMASTCAFLAASIASIWSFAALLMAAIC